MHTVATLDELAQLAEQRPRMFVRWSRGPNADASASSADELTGTPMPGLSASSLAVEPWWRDRPMRLWLARRLHDYRRLERDRAPGVRPWVLEGEEIARGSGNEPLVSCTRPVAWVADDVIAEADLIMSEQDARWGPLRRPHA